MLYEIESHPTGGKYNRPDNEGGGQTETYAFEQCRYRYMEGIGSNIIIEFVDPSGTSEYHMPMDPGEKDALAKIPGAGLSMMEQMGMSSKTQRFTPTDGPTAPRPMSGDGLQTDNQFTRPAQLAKE